MVKLLAVLATLMILGCSEEKIQHSPVSGPGPYSGEDIYQVEVDVLGDASPAERYEIGLEVAKALSKPNRLASIAGIEKASPIDINRPGKITFLVSMTSSSSLLIFKSDRVFVTCSVSHFENNEAIGAQCREELMSELNSSFTVS